MILEKMHRTTVALLGAAIMIIVGLAGNFYTPQNGLEAIDFNTLGLLFGMMVIVGVIAETGFFDFIAVRMTKIACGDYWMLMLMFGLVSAASSAFLDNVTTVLLLIPVTISIAKSLEVNPIPIIMVEILASNIGGTATLVGDPPNIMIGSAANLSFVSFIVNVGPIVVITMLISIFLLKWVYRDEIQQSPKNLGECMDKNEWDEIKNMKLLRKSLIITGLVVFFFLIHHTIGIEPAVVALIGAVILLAWGGIHPGDALRHVHWSTLLFFAGLFVLVGGLVQVGVMQILGESLAGMTGGNLFVALIFIIWVSALASTFLDNIPFTATMIPIIFAMEPLFSIEEFFINPMWWALSIGACFGGNGSLVGASANMVAAGISEKFGFPITFRGFMAKGFPFMILTLIIGTALLLLMVALQLALL
jgi:Na+/H+ antiporter NhaD/arsenite permease-like protein